MTRRRLVDVARFFGSYVRKGRMTGNPQVIPETRTHDYFWFADHSTRNPFFGSQKPISFWKLRSFGWAGLLFIDAA